MSTFDYSELAAVAQELLEEFGSQTTLTRPGEPVYDPETGEATVEEVVSTVQAAVFPVEQRYVDGLQVLATDLQAYVSAVGVSEPKPGDVLSWQEQGLTVVKAKNLAPDGSTFVLFELFVGLR